MSHVTVFAVLTAVLMLGFLFVDVSSGKARNTLVMQIEGGIFVVALMVAFLSHFVY